MLVREVMTPNPITVRPESDYLAAIALMRAGRFRHLPVVDEQNRPVGILAGPDLGNIQTENELKQQAIRGDGVLLRVQQVMKSPVITTTPDYPLEEAARLMVDHHINSLPVVEEGRLVGIVTSIDIFRTFVNILGGGGQTIRVCVQVDNKPGQFASLTGKVAEAGGNILAITSYPAETPDRINLIMRVDAATLDILQAAISAHPKAEIGNIWEQG